MGVFERALVLGLLLAVCAPRSAAAAPIVDGLEGPTCGSLVGETSLACGLFDLDPFDARNVDGSLGSASDLALFEFVFTEETRLTITTASYVLNNFDPTLGLYQRTGEILSVPDPSSPGALMFARFFDVSLETQNYDDHIDVTLGPGSYLMALYGNELGESLLSPLLCDDPALGCTFDRGSTFSFAVSANLVADGEPAPVPEPGTLTLMAGGAIAGLIQRRRTKKRIRAEPRSR
jgi:hypothetical protein